MNKDTLVSKIPQEILKSEGEERQQAFVDLFGELVFSLREKALWITNSLLTSEEARKKAGTLPAQPFAHLSALSEDQLEDVMKVCGETVDAFTRMLITFIDHTGTQLEIDNRHVAQFRLLLQMIDRQTDACIEEIQLNKNREIKFFKSWGRWLRRYHSARQNSEATNEDQGRAK